MLDRPYEITGGLEHTRFVTSVFGWMAIAMGVTTLACLIVPAVPALSALILGNQAVFLTLLFMELGTVWFLSARMHKMELATVQAWFVGYSLLNGLTLSVIFLAFTAESIASTFVVTAGMFGATAAYGYFTKADLTKWGSLLLMGLFGLIIAGVVNIFWASSALYWGTTILGIIIFVGLTAYDMQRLKTLSAGEFESGEVAAKEAIRGALMLYLDFVNMFLYLLRLFGKRK